jgi:hypothetical protein
MGRFPLQKVVELAYGFASGFAYGERVASASFAL